MRSIAIISLLIQAASAEVHEPLNLQDSTWHYLDGHAIAPSWIHRAAVAKAASSEEDGWMRVGLHGRRSQGTKPPATGYDDYEEEEIGSPRDRLMDSDKSGTGHDLPLSYDDDTSYDGSHDIGAVDSRPNSISPKNELYWISRGMAPKWRSKHGNKHKHSERANLREMKYSSEYKSGKWTDNGDSDVEEDLSETYLQDFSGFPAALIFLLSGIGAILTMLHLRRGTPAAGKEPLLGM